MLRTRTSRWTAEETKRFYAALRQCGTDFTTMELMFPSRDRAQLKNKFKREEREHPDLVYRYLDCQQPLDLEPFEACLGLLAVGTAEEAGGGKVAAPPPAAPAAAEEAAPAPASVPAEGLHQEGGGQGKPSVGDDGDGSRPEGGENCGSPIDADSRNG